MNDETKQNENTATAGQNEADQQRKMYGLQRMYLKDVSFESPNAPDIFTEAWKPQLNLNIKSNSREIDENLYEVVLTLTLDAKQDDKTAFLVELQQAGIFQVEGFEPQDLHRILGLHCPENLYPFAREAIASLTMHGSFPQVLLQPINFEALYRRNLEEQIKLAEAEQGGEA